MTKTSFYRYSNQKGSTQMVALIVVAFLVLAASGAFVAYKFLQKKVGAGGTVNFSEKVLVTAPQNTSLIFSAQLEKMGLNGAFVRDLLSLSSAKREYEEFKNEVKTKTGKEWKDEYLDLIVPKSFAVFLAIDPSLKPGDLKAQINQHNLQSVDLVIMCELTDAAKWLSFVQDNLVSAIGKDKITTEDYQGIKIYLGKPDDGLQPAFSVNEGILYLSPTPASLKKALGGSKSPIKDGARFKSAMAEFSSGNDNFFFADIKEVLRHIPEATADLAQVPVAQKLVGALDWLAAATKIDANKHGITQSKLKLNLPAGDPLSTALAPTGFSLAAAKSMPPKVSMYMSYGLRPIYDLAMRVLSADPNTQPMTGMPQMLLAEKGIDLQQDILDVLTGELAMAIIPEAVQLPPGQDDLSMLPIPGGSAAAQAFLKDSGFMLMLGIKDRAKTEAVLAKFAGPMLEQTPAEDYKGAKIRVFGPVAAGYVDNFLVVAGLGGRERLVKLLDGSERLAGNNEYKNIPPTSGKSDGLFESYMDAEAYFRMIAAMPGAYGSGISAEDLPIMQKIYGRMGLNLNRLSLVADGIEAQTSTQFK